MPTQSLMPGEYYELYNAVIGLILCWDVREKFKQNIHIPTQTFRAFGVIYPSEMRCFEESPKRYILGSVSDN